MTLPASVRAALRRTRAAGVATCWMVATLAAGGCGERVNITGAGGASRTGTSSTGGSASALDARLVGQWSRTLLLQDNSGAIQASRTTWRFRPDASASRAVVASNLTFGLVDSVVTVMRWRTDGREVIVSYTSPGAGDVRFEYRFDGAALILGGLRFDRQ